MITTQSIGLSKFAFKGAPYGFSHIDLYGLTQYRRENKNWSFQPKQVNKLDRKGVVKGDPK